jgi:serine/threonine protein kinase
MFSIGATLAELSSEQPRDWLAAYSVNWKKNPKTFRRNFVIIVSEFKRAPARVHNGIHDLVGLLLSVDPHHRPSAREALNHEWLADE